MSPTRADLRRLEMRHQHLADVAALAVGRAGRNRRLAHSRRVAFNELLDRMQVKIHQAEIALRADESLSPQEQIARRADPYAPAGPVQRPRAPAPTPAPPSVAEWARSNVGYSCAPGSDSFSTW